MSLWNDIVGAAEGLGVIDQDTAEFWAIGDVDIAAEARRRIEAGEQPSKVVRELSGGDPERARAIADANAKSFIDAPTNAAGNLDAAADAVTEVVTGGLVGGFAEGMGKAVVIVGSVAVVVLVAPYVWPLVAKKLEDVAVGEGG